MTVYRLYTTFCLECKLLMKNTDSAHQSVWATFHVENTGHDVTETLAEETDNMFTLRSRKVRPVGGHAERGEWSSCAGHPV